MRRKKISNKKREDLLKRLKEEKKSKKWFFDTYLPDMFYTSAYQQTSGMYGIDENVEMAIDKYLEEKC